MRIALLDLNVLTALLWPAHEHHDAAHRWFGGRRGGRWASCPFTQLGFVRITSNPMFSRDALSPAQASALLAENLARPTHVFWSDSLPVDTVVKAVEVGLQGYRQLTDAYLLALAHTHGGVLASFDAGLRALVGRARASALEIVSTE